MELSLILKLAGAIAAVIGALLVRLKLQQVALDAATKRAVSAEVDAGVAAKKQELKDMSDKVTSSLEDYKKKKEAYDKIKSNPGNQ